MLVPGLEPADHSAICKENLDTLEYFEPTGYRRIPLTTCEGGRELDRIRSVPCPGKEKEVAAKNGISALGLFFAIVIPITVALGVGYYVYTNWDTMAGFGQIRLGEGMGTSSFFGGASQIGAGGTSSGESPFITVPVAIVSGIWAVTKATPLLAMSLWRSARGYMPVSRGSGGTAPYTSRGAFADRRQDYANVVEDEDELLGDDLDEGEEV